MEIFKTIIPVKYKSAVCIMFCCLKMIFCNQFHQQVWGCCLLGNNFCTPCSSNKRRYKSFWDFSHKNLLSVWKPFEIFLLKTDWRSRSNWLHPAHSPLLSSGWTVCSDCNHHDRHYFHSMVNAEICFYFYNISWDFRLIAWCAFR